MRRPTHTSLFAAVIGALLISAALCFPSLGGSVPGDTTGRVTAAATVSWSLDRTREPGPRHPHHHHGTDCATPGLAPQSVAATQGEVDAAALVPSFDGSPVPARLQLSASAGPRRAIADTGRSTQIRVCTWRV
ncbi:hypothetical protein [Streptomyces sp. NPDC126499]|uniref:hypothetical protein n=1 Tax=Streptomyces sp. NPDC126499 TaxID=3155314 RepID=UPI003331108A